jgi:gliding motility-associated-like protein
VPDQSINSKYQTELMKKQTAFALLFLLSLSLPLLAQVNRCSYVIPRHTDNWLFHRNSGIHFEDNSVSLISQPLSNLRVGLKTSTFSDVNGILLAYTDGAFVYNGNHERINFGDNLRGGTVSPSIIVPKPKSDNILYIFTIDIDYMNRPQGLFYSTVDLSLGGGVGSVSERNRELFPQTAGLISAVENRNKDGYWVVSRGLGNSSFYAFKVTSTGIEATPVESSNMGTALNDNQSDLLGTLKISPKGDRLSFCSYGRKVVELFDFDNETGRVSNPVTITLPDPLHVPDAAPYSLEFSKDGTKLYVNMYSLFNSPTAIFVNSRVYQYDLTNGMQMTLLNESPLAQNLNSLQLGRDGKIYITRQGSSALSVIGSPDRPGTACNFLDNGIDVPATDLLRFGLPTFIQSYFNNPHFDYDTKCDGDITEFWLHNPTYSDGTTTWDFGDAGNTTPGTGINPTHQFSGPGVYNVTVTERWNGESFTTTLQVIINQLPPKSFEAKGDSMYLFPGSRIPLDGGQGMFSYYWQDGSNNQYFDVDSPGLIVVEYEDMNCCRNSDSLKVIALDISLPNAFTPDGNGVNDYFKALGPSDGIEDFTLLIYNRWGQRIWEAKNFADKWDGTLNGQKLPSGVYAWYLTFNVIGNISSIGKVKYKGSVTLLR